MVENSTQRLRLSPIKIATVVVLGGFLVALVVVSTIFLFRHTLATRYQELPSTKQVSPLPSPTLDPLRPYAIALLGNGGPGHQGGSLTDTMMIARIDPRRKTVHLISVPRDAWVQLPTGSEGTLQGWKLNAAFAIGNDDRSYPHKPTEYTTSGGGVRLAAFALEQISGLPIQNVVAVNFYGFVKAIDALGGIVVDVDHTFDDFWYPIASKEQDTCGLSEEEIQAVTATMSGTKLEEHFPCRYEHLHFEQGEQQMDGETALKFVRSRHGEQDGNDFGRAARQRKVVLAVRDKVFQIHFLPKAVPFITALANNIQTDLALSDWQQYLTQADELRSYQVISVAITDQTVLKAARSANGQFILIPKDATDSAHPDWTSVRIWLDTVFSDVASGAAEIKGTNDL